MYLRTKPKSISDFIAEVDGWCSDSSDNSSSSLTRQNITRIICKLCSCTYEEGGDYLRCEQNREYEESLRADAAVSSLPDVICVDPMLGSGSSHTEQATGSIQAQTSSGHEEQPF